METKDKWFRNSPLGIFLHWGVYSAIGRGEWVMQHESIPLDEYDSNAKYFQAEHYDPDVWAAAAKSAGAEYIVLTTKHHDGFCLFDTVTTNRNTVVQGPKRDLIKPFADACRKHGLRVGLYYSPSDWGFAAYNNGPDYNIAAWNHYIDCIHTQVRELMTNYGKIDILWYDGAPNLHGKGYLGPQRLRAAELNAMVRQLQPDILINNRCGLPEDFDTPEQKTTAPANPDRPWESCMTMNKHWGYFPVDDCYKSPTEIMITMTVCAMHSGHLLLNVGPRPDGTLPEREMATLQTIGRWLSTCGEALRGTRFCDIRGGSYGCTSQKDDCVYLYVHWPHAGGVVTVPDCTEEFQRAILLNTGAELSMHRRDTRLFISGVEGVEHGMLPVIKLMKKLS